MRGLRAQQLDQRFTTAEGVLMRLGQVESARERGHAQSIVLKTPKTPPDLIALAEQRLTDWRARGR